MNLRLVTVTGLTERLRANETRSNWTRSIFSVPMRRVSVGRVPMRRVPNRRGYIVMADTPCTFTEVRSLRSQLFKLVVNQTSFT